MTKHRYAWFIGVVSFLISIRVAAEDLAIKQIAATNGTASDIEPYDFR